MTIGEQWLFAEAPGYYVGLAFRQTSALQETLLDGLVAVEAHLAIDGGQIEIAPVNTDMVTGLGKYRLLNGTSFQILHAVVLDEGRTRGLARLVLSNHGRCRQHELYIVGCAVG